MKTNLAEVQQVNSTDLIQVAVGELSKVSPDAAIAELSKRYMVLKINGLEDKKGYDAVHSARMDVKNRRIAVEKKRKELKEDALKFGKAVDAEAGRIKDLLAPIENHLETEESAVDQERARIKAEAERKEQERVQGRVNRLFDMGCRFDGQNFSLSFAPQGFFVPQPLVKTANDEQWATMLGELQKLIDAENARLAEVERLRQEEEARLAKIREEQEAEARRLAEVARKQKEEEDRIRREQEAERKRIADELRAAEDKLRAEREAIEKEKRAIEEAKAREEAEKRHQAELEQARKEAEERALAAAEAKAKKESEEKAAAEAEAKRFEEMRPDKEKLLKLAEALESFELPVLKHKKPISILTQAKDDLDSVARFIRGEVGQLKPRKRG